MDSTIIISRYNEDIQWFSDLNTFSKKIIYNKGDELEPQKNIEIINLPNVGRESHTWLYHIVKNFETLSSYNIFLQGRIEEKSKLFRF